MKTPTAHETAEFKRIVEAYRAHVEAANRLRCSNPDLDILLRAQERGDAAGVRQVEAFYWTETDARRAA